MWLRINTEFFDKKHEIDFGYFGTGQDIEFETEYGGAVCYGKNKIDIQKPNTGLLHTSRYRFSLRRKYGLFHKKTYEIYALNQVDNTEETFFRGHLQECVALSNRFLRREDRVIIKKLEKCIKTHRWCYTCGLDCNALLLPSLDEKKYKKWRQKNKKYISAYNQTIKFIESLDKITGYEEQAKNLEKWR